MCKVSCVIIIDGPSGSKTDWEIWVNDPMDAFGSC